MKAFISYASEYRNIADRIAVGLRQEGVDVFFDRDQLPSGDAYDIRIRKAIQRSDLFIFLISPESVSKNAYALTEVGFAREKWKNPTGRVLPVFVAKTNLDDVPGCLRSVTILKTSTSYTTWPFCSNTLDKLKNQFWQGAWLSAFKTRIKIKAEFI